MTLSKRQLEYQRKWRAATPEKQAKYNLATRLRMRAYHHTPERKDWEKQYRKDHCELYDKSRRKYTDYIKKNEPWRWWHWQVKARCSNKCLYYRKVGVKYQLSLEQMKSLWLRDKAYLLKEPSIDRINTTGNYTFDNCRFIELSVNNKRVKGKYHQQGHI